MSLKIDSLGTASEIAPRWILRYLIDDVNISSGNGWFLKKIMGSDKGVWHQKIYIELSPHDHIIEKSETAIWCCVESIATSQY